VTGLESLDALTFASYKANRRLYPDVPVRHWELIFGLEHGRRYEQMWQEEQVNRLEYWLERCWANVEESKRGKP
jgi:hypothetical protein